ncbi:MAG TPA: glycosyltransferase family 4 protein, partial [Prosthecobacter sp.]
WERKGLPWLLKFMTERGDDASLKLLVVSRDRMRGTVPPNVILAGALPDVENAYAAADLLTFLPIYEPCSNVVSEALATGIPVVTTIYNGASELIEPGINGHVLHDPRDLEALATAVDHWRAGTHSLPVPTAQPLDLETNVQETLRVIELAAQSRD